MSAASSRASAVFKSGAAPAVFIDGEAGTTGLGIRQRLSGLTTLSLLSIAPEARKDPSARQPLMEQADVLILCLPDEAAREAVALADALGPDAPRVLDASSAHRIAPGWVFGFPELAEGHAEAIRTARHVSNPGCYATGAIALLRPLVDAGVIPRDHPLSINAVSGYSGGGRTMIEAHEAMGGPPFELYALGLEQKHIPEIERHAGLTRRPIFIPSIAHFRQGILVSIPLHLDDLPNRPSGGDIVGVLAAHYEDAPGISVSVEPILRLEPEGLNDGDRMSLHVFANEALRQAVLVARLDNLGKGASGAAVQNLRLMLSLAG